MATETMTTSRGLTVALAGNPNVGKSTLFNALTGLKAKVANYPGVTVEKKVGTLALPLAETQNAKLKTQNETALPRAAHEVRSGAAESFAAQLVDLPGTYSLAGRSPDEHVATQVVLGQMAGTPRPDVIVVVCDASNLERNLYLVTQVLELGRPTVVALTMMDIAREQGKHIDVAKLSLHLRAPVVAVQANKGIGVDDLKKAIAKAAHHKGVALELPLPEVMQTHVDRLQAILVEEKVSLADQAEFDAHLMIGMGEDDGGADVSDARRQLPRVRAELAAALEACAKADVDPIASEIDAHYQFIGNVVADVLRVDAPTLNYRTVSTSDKIDRVLTHKVWGLAIFVAIMALVFVSIFKFAAPVMDFLKDDVIGGAGGWLAGHMSDGPLRSLLVDGVIAGVGNVVVFLPQIAILFLFLAILEDSGYMSRAAFLMDRIMSKVGLHGKSFIPMLSGYACAVPAIMGTRVIENRRDRLATILVLPLMSCSARLPVYALVIATFFGGMSALAQGGILLTMYALGTLGAFAMAWLLKRTLLKGPPPAFILEMPPYRLPNWKVVATTVGSRCWAFVKRAGTVIFAFSVIMWAATNYPKPKQFDRDYGAATAALEARQAALAATMPASLRGALESGANDPPLPPDPSVTAYIAASHELDALHNARKQEVLEHSVAGRVGKFIEPVFRPLGYDWKLSVGVTGAFFAREVIVSTMGIVYSVGEVDETSEALQEKIRTDYSPLVGVSLMVFVVFCMQCLSTLAVARRETGHWGWPAFMFVYMTAMAWVAAFVTYQGGKWLGF